MRRLSTLFLWLLSLTASTQVYAQCATPAVLNWDALDFLSFSGGYTTYITEPRAANQTFAIGKNSLNITYATTKSAGENALHTGEVGDDVQFTGNGTITLTFANPVSNLQFSVYDVDKGQSIAFTATGTGTAILVSKADPTSTLINTTANSVTSVSGSEANSDLKTTARVLVTGSVKSVTLTITGSDSRSGGASDQHFWLSDIQACVTETFSANYYSVSRPFNGPAGLANQPGYVLQAVNNMVYMVNPATGRSQYIFTSGCTSCTVNSLAYDPYNRIAYYCHSLTNNGAPNASGKSLFKYDMNTGTTTTLINDVTSIGIPVYGQGVESGGAAFYDGYLYLAIEGGADNGANGNKVTTGIESSVWRIDLASTPMSAVQVYSVSGDAHDFGDFSVYDGVLYDFNSDAATPNYVHYNLHTGTLQPFASSPSPKQSATSWDGKLYSIGNTVAQYNMAGGIVSAPVALTATPTFGNFGTTSAPSFGDAAEAFRPKADFGDAPASYDPDPLAPAVHELSTNLYLGPSVDVEWDKNVSSDAFADAADDGLTYVRIMSTASGEYQTEVRVFNNTGAPATVAAWIDFNLNGVFDSNEGVVQTVATSTSIQNVSLYWTGITQALPSYSSVFMRIRVTSAANNMTAAHATGYFSNGEVEDWQVPVNMSVLPMRLLSFVAKKQGDEKVVLQWKIADEEAGTRYLLQKSADGQHWLNVSEVTGSSKSQYEVIDQNPSKPHAFYRLQYTEPNGKIGFSNVQQVQYVGQQRASIIPNPASTSATFQVYVAEGSPGRMLVSDESGRNLYSAPLMLQKGSNTIPLPFVSGLAPGMYYVQVQAGVKTFYQKLVKMKH